MLVPHAPAQGALFQKGSVCLGDVFYLSAVRVDCASLVTPLQLRL